MSLIILTACLVGALDATLYLVHRQRRLERGVHRAIVARLRSYCA